MPPLFINEEVCLSLHKGKMTGLKESKEDASISFICLVDMTLMKLNEMKPLRHRVLLKNSNGFYSHHFLIH